MRVNYLRQKALEKKYKKGQLPKEEAERKRIDDACSFKMTAIMKKMHSPTALGPNMLAKSLLNQRKASSV